MSAIPRIAVALWFLVAGAGTCSAIELRLLECKAALTSSGRNEVGDYSDRIVAWGTGLGFEWQVINFLSLRTDIEYVRRGWVIRNVPLTDGTTVDLETAYDRLSIPFLLQGRLRSGAFQPFGQIGPQLNFLIDVDDDISLDDHPEHLRTLILGGVLAIGVQYVGRSPLIISATLRSSFDITDADNLEYFLTKTNSVDAWLGIGYALGAKVSGQQAHPAPAGL